MAEVKPLKLIDQGGGNGALAEFGAGDKLDPETLQESLKALAALTGAADRVPYFTDQGVMALAVLTGLARTLLAAADAAELRAVLGLGSAALKNIGTSGDAVPLLNASNTWSAIQRLSSPTARVEVQGNAPSIWLDESDSSVGLNFVLDTGVFQLQRRAANFGGFERTIFSINLSAPATSLVVASSGMVSVNAGALQLASFTVATLPSAAANVRGQVYCSNLAGQAAPVYSDGTNWRRFSDNSIAN